MRGEGIGKINQELRTLGRPLAAGCFPLAPSCLHFRDTRPLSGCGSFVFDLCGCDDGPCNRVV